jgi:hypothetical protein
VSDGAAAIGQRRCIRALPSLRHAAATPQPLVSRHILHPLRFRFELGKQLGKGGFGTVRFAFIFRPSTLGP